MYPSQMEVFGTASGTKIATTGLVDIKDQGLDTVTVNMIYRNANGNIERTEASYLICEKEFPGFTLQDWPLPPPPIVVPTPPNMLEARHLADRVELIWVDQDNQNTPTTFEIQSSQDGGVWMQETIVSEGVVTYIDKGASPLSKYRYRIRGINIAGEGDWSTEVEAAPFTYPNPVDGTTIQPGTDVSKLHALKSGQVYIAEDGTYRGNTLESGVRIIARNLGKCFLEGNGSFAAQAATDCEIVGFVFHYPGQDTQDNSKASVLVGARWKLTDCLVEGGLGVGLGIMKVDGVILTRVISRANGRAGIGGTSVSNCRTIDCETSHNNSKGDPNGGGGKFTRTKSLVHEGLWSYDNNGPGTWLDYNNINVTYKKSATRPTRIWLNKDYYSGGKLKAGGSGIFFEISGIVDGTNTWGLLLLDGVLAYNNRVGISANELKLSGKESVNFRSCSNVEARNCEIDLIIMSGAEGKRTESADRGDNIWIHDCICVSKIQQDSRFGNVISKGKVRIENILYLGKLPSAN